MNKFFSSRAGTRKVAQTVLAVFLVAGWMGCVGGGSGGGAREINLEPVKDAPKYMVLRDVNGVRLEWKSKPGQRYVVKYRDPHAAATDYRVLPGGGNIEGTGGTIRIKDPSPLAPRRAYRVELVMRPRGIPLE